MDRKKLVLYNCLLFGGGLAAAPFFLAKLPRYRKGLKQKLGLLPPPVPPASGAGPRVWVNAVSVGEVMVAGALIREIKKLIPDADIVVSTGTDTGREAGAEIAGGDVSAFFYYPLDIPGAVERAVEAVKPDLFIATESEIWPNMLACLKKKGSGIMLANGRVSRRSFARCRRAKFFWGEVLNSFDRLCVVSDEEKRKMAELGAAPGKITVAGNCKFDIMASALREERSEALREEMGIGEHEQVFIAASLHPGEFGIIADVFDGLSRIFPRLTLVAAPRHPERACLLGREFSIRGIDYCLRSGMRKGEQRSGEPVIIIDTVGELFRVYGTASAVFCGGSLVPRGGQNIIEPAAWGRVVLFGPHMEDFEHEKRMLEEAGAGHTVRSAAELRERVENLISNPAEAEAAGAGGRKAVLGSAGASAECARAAASILGRSVNGTDGG